MKILLLSAYDAASHRYWREGLVEALPEHEWTVLTLPARFFSWRIRGNSLSWAFSQTDTLQQRYDLVFATSMVDLSALRGLVPALAEVPTLVYFHENQFDYPLTDKAHSSLEPRVLNLYTALAADRVLFNSEYNQQTLLDGVDELLRKMPDQVPQGICERLAERSAVLPVPLSADCFQRPQRDAEFTIVWSHRWEYDKGPELLLGAMRRLQAQDKRFKLHVLGQQFRSLPESFQKLHRELTPSIGQWGFVESRQDYLHLLQRADVVLSTALHDFQGIAVLEGVAAGAFPVVPDRLAYRELFPVQCRYAAAAGEQEETALATMLGELIDARDQGRMPVSPDVSRLAWQQLVQDYRQVISETAFLEAD